MKSVLEKIEGTCSQLDPLEQGVVLRLAERLLLGQTQYGPLRGNLHKKNWAKEAVDEVLDLALYLSFREEQDQ